MKDFSKGSIISQLFSKNGSLGKKLSNLYSTNYKKNLGSDVAKSITSPRHVGVKTVASAMSTFKGKTTNDWNNHLKTYIKEGAIFSKEAKDLVRAQHAKLPLK